MSNSDVVLVAGEGGHNMQMMRLADLIGREGKPVSFICEARTIPSHMVRVLLPDRISKLSKDSGVSFVGTFFFMIKLFFLTLFSFLRSRPVGVVFHGPLFCIPVYCVCFLLRIKCINIESWSKFEHPSKTCKFLYMAGVRTYYQNLEIARFYPKGLYSGRL